MNNKIQDAFSSIHATNELKLTTVNAIYKSLEQKQKPTKNAHFKPMLALCSIALVMLVGMGTYSVYAMPVSYISIDINPSIELSLNRMDYVVRVEAYNDGGATVLENLNLENKSYTDAIEALLANETFSNYIADDSLLSFTVVSENQEKLLTGIQECSGYSKEQSKCKSAEPDMLDEARGKGMSFGKYQAFLELSKYDESITPEHCKNLSMREIQDLIDSSAGDVDITTNKPMQGHHNGNGNANKNDNSHSNNRNSNGDNNINNNGNGNAGAGNDNRSDNANSNANNKNDNRDKKNSRSSSKPNNNKKIK